MSESRPGRRHPCASSSPAAGRPATSSRRCPLADALRRRDPATEVTVLGTARGLETRLVPARGYALELVPAVPVPRRPSADLVSLPGRVRAPTRAAERVLETTGADVLVGFGGYAAAPAYLAARRRHVPFVVHEANARPGLANRLGARWTPYVAVAVAGTKLRARRSTSGCRCAPRSRRWTVRPAGPRPRSPSAWTRHCRRCWSSAARRGRGGSTVRSRVPLDALLAAGVQVLHVVGPGNAGPDRDDGEPAAPDRDRYVRVGYCDRMDLAYAAADLVLCRAGMTTCAELAAVGLPAVYVPLPIGNGEQRLNAEPVVTAGGGLLVDDAACTPQWLRCHGAAAAARRRPAGRDGSGRRDPGRARRGRAAGRHGAARGRAARVMSVSPGAGTPSRREPGPRALRGRRRRRHVRHRADPHRARDAGVRAATPRTPASWRRCACSARTCTSGTAPSRCTAPTRWSCPRPCATTTPRCARRTGWGCASFGARRRSRR